MELGGLCRQLRHTTPHHSPSPWGKHFIEKDGKKVQDPRGGAQPGKPQKRPWLAKCSQFPNSCPQSEPHIWFLHQAVSPQLVTSVFKSPNQKGKWILTQTLKRGLGCQPQWHGLSGAVLPAEATAPIIRVQPIPQGVLFLCTVDRASRGPCFFSDDHPAKVLTGILISSHCLKVSGYPPLLAAASTWFLGDLCPGTSLLPGGVGVATTPPASPGPPGHPPSPTVLSLSPLWPSLNHVLALDGSALNVTAGGSESQWLEPGSPGNLVVGKHAESWVVGIWGQLGGSGGPSGRGRASLGGSDQHWVDLG